MNLKGEPSSTLWIAKSLWGKHSSESRLKSDGFIARTAAVEQRDRQGQGNTIQVHHGQRRKQGPAPEIKQMLEKQRQSSCIPRPAGRSVMCIHMKQTKFHNTTNPLWIMDLEMWFRKFTPRRMAPPSPLLKDSAPSPLWIVDMLVIILRRRRYIFIPYQPGRSQDLLSDLGCNTAWNLHVREMQVQSSEQRLRRQVSCVNLPSLGVLWEERLRRGSLTQGKEKKELQKKVTWMGVFIKGRNLEKTVRGPEKYWQIQSFH